MHKCASIFIYYNSTNLTRILINISCNLVRNKIDDLYIIYNCTLNLFNSAILIKITEIVIS